MLRYARFIAGQAGLERGDDLPGDPPVYAGAAGWR
jgi:hypothetical protein